MTYGNNKSPFLTIRWTEFACNFCAQIGPLQFGVMLVVFLFNPIHPLKNTILIISQGQGADDFFIKRLNLKPMHEISKSKHLMARWRELADR